MSEITIRKLQKKDLYNGFLLSLDSLRKSSHINSKKANSIFGKISRKKDQLIYVAVLNNEIVGTASILIEQKFIHEGGKVGHIEDVAVKKEFQGKGIGRRVVKALLDYGEKEGCYKTILDCSEDLVPFYKSLGFKKFSESMRFDYRSKI